jgi:hypothetical protein
VNSWALIEEMLFQCMGAWGLLVIKQHLALPLRFVGLVPRRLKQIPWINSPELPQGLDQKILQKNIDRPWCYRYSGGCFEAHRAIPLGKPIDEID